MKHTLRMIAGVAVLFALSACRAPADNPADQAEVPMVLKIYAAPSGQASQLAQSLGRVLGKKASITSPAPGKLLVYAPSNAQASIGDAISSLGKSTESDQTPAQVDLHFWVVDAQSGPGTDDAALAPMTSALDSVRKRIGPLHFQLDQAVSAMASVGHNGSIKTAKDGGYMRSFDFQISGGHGNTIDLMLAYADQGQTGLAELETQLDVTSGHYVVLAQAPGACAQALIGKAAPACPQKPALRLLIVRADRLPPPA